MGIKLFRENFRYLRKKHRMTQEDIAKRIGVKRSTYAHWESYGTSLLNSIELIKIVKEFGYTIEFLMIHDLKNNTLCTPIPLDDNTDTGLPNNDTLQLQFNHILSKLRKIKYRMLL